MGKGGGGSPPPAPTQVSQLTIPEYAQPYMEKLLGRTEALTSRRLPVYTGARIAPQSVAQREVQQSVRNLQTPGGFRTAENMAVRAGQEALARSQYTPGQFQMMNVQAPGPIMGVQAPMLQQFGMQGAQTGFRPQVSTPAMFGNLQAQAYMSPYMQNVVDIQKRKAIEDAQLTQLGANLAAPRQGTYGGARQLLAQTQREKGLREQLGDIQARGLQTSFEQAQQQFERDRAALMQAEALRTDVGLKTALANLDAEQQARVQNLAATLQTQGLSADQALKAALANQQQYGQFQEMAQRAELANQEQYANLQKMAEQSRQFGADLGLRGVDLFGAAGRDVSGIATQQAEIDLRQKQLQAQIAEQERLARQAELDAELARFQEEQSAAYKQLGFMSDILRGTGALAGGRAVYEAPQSLAQQAVGVGLPALALARGLGA